MAKTSTSPAEKTRKAAHEKKSTSGAAAWAAYKRKRNDSRAVTWVNGVAHVKTTYQTPKSRVAE